MMVGQRATWSAEGQFNTHESPPLCSDLDNYAVKLFGTLSAFAYDKHNQTTITSIIKGEYYAELRSTVSNHRAHRRPVWIWARGRNGIRSSQDLFLHLPRIGGHFSSDWTKSNDLNSSLGYQYQQYEMLYAPSVSKKYPYRVSANESLETRFFCFNDISCRCDIGHSQTRTCRTIAIEIEATCLRAKDKFPKVANLLRKITLGVERQDPFDSFCFSGTYSFEK